MIKSILYSLVTLLLGLSARAEVDSAYQVKPSGQIHLNGVVERTLSPNTFRIGLTQFKFAKGKVVNGFHFDKSSQQSYVGQEVEALAKATPEGILVTALVSAKLFSARPFVLSTLAERYLHSSFNRSQTKFSLIKTKGAFKSPISFRETLLEKRQVSAGERALIITFSGSQGDDSTSAFGHFAFGQAVVRQDGSLETEISNFYPAVNEKAIEPGHVNAIDYFGNVTSGQNQYRPTFTLIIYGISQESINASKAYMNSVYKFLYANKEFSVGNNFNCTTESANAVQAAKIDVFMRPESLKFFLNDKIAQVLDLREHTQLNKPQQLAYFMFRDNARFLPRRAFERVLNNVMSTGEMNGEPVARMDYVFQGQVVSGRPRGFLAAGSLGEYVRIKPYFALQSLKRKVQQ